MKLIIESTRPIGEKINYQKYIKMYVTLKQNRLHAIKYDPDTF